MQVQLMKEGYEDAMDNKVLINSIEKTIIMVGWKPPENNWVKLNTNGFVSKEDELVAVV